MNVTEGGAPPFDIGAGALYEEAIYHAYENLDWHHTTNRIRHQLLALGLETLTVFS